MVYHVDTHHPRTKDEHGSRMKIPLCCGGSSVGYHALPWQDSPVKEAGDLTSLGIGIILYFKFLVSVCMCVTGRGVEGEREHTWL